MVHKKLNNSPVARARRAAGLKQIELAKLLNISRERLSNYERADRTISDKTSAFIAKQIELLSLTNDSLSQNIVSKQKKRQKEKK